MTMLRPTTDGVVTIRPSTPDDIAALVAGRDEQSRRYLGDGAPDPQPTGCIVVGGDVVGWVDVDDERPWLLPGECNLGYEVFADRRGNGYATRALQLLMHHLSMVDEHSVATLLIAPTNTSSLGVAARARFIRQPDLDGNSFWKRPVPPLTYTDGVVTIRPRHIDDLDAEMAAKDELQMHWLWDPDERRTWATMTAGEQRAHARARLRFDIDAFTTGPKWTFAIDTADAATVGYIDGALANEDVPFGEANIAFAGHPGHRGRGHISRAVHLIVQFVRDHTGAREAHLCIDETNVASLRVAASVGASETERWSDADGRRFVRHVMRL